MKCILSIDGGGIRGIIPALILAEIEKRTGEKTYKLFDLIAGTSFSSIIGALAVCPNPLGLWASEITDILENNAAKLFNRKHFSKFRALFNPFTPKYEESNLHYVLDQIIGNCELKNALTELVIPSYDLTLKQPYIFKRGKAMRKPGDNFQLSEVLKAATAKPTYFEPYDLGDKLLTDGSIYANNPSMCALTEAINIMPFRSFCMVSLGCGFSSVPNNKHFTLRGNSSFSSYEDILLASIDGINKTVHYECSQILTKQHYYRLQPFMDRRIEIDEVSNDAIHYLKSVAEDFIRNNSEEIDKICRLLSNKQDSQITMS